MNRIITGDCRTIMRSLIADGVKVQCVITSPPYWRLRDYGVAGQLGLEPTIREYLDNMVGVFDLVRDLMADDGTLWLNMGDSYAGSNRGGQTSKSGLQGSTDGQNQSKLVRKSFRRDKEPTPRSDNATPGLKPKDMVGMPWRLAFALQDAGWWLRQDIIWHKPNPMPETVADRCTKAHEYLFLLSKSERYFYDAKAIAEPASEDTHARMARAHGGYAPPGQLEHHGILAPRPNVRMVKPIAGWNYGEGKHDFREHGTSAKDSDRQEQGLKDSTKFGRGPGWRNKTYGGTGVGFGHGFDADPKPRVKNNPSFHEAMSEMPDARNKRSVWTIPTQPYSEAHFATFPEKLVEPCVMAGSRAGDVVFDPFMGSGTVAQVAQRLNRQYLGCDLNPANEPMQAGRLRQQVMVLA